MDDQSPYILVNPNGLVVTHGIGTVVQAEAKRALQKDNYGRDLTLVYGVGAPAGSIYKEAPDEE